MKLPQNWLIATDGSKYATMSVQYAAQLYKFLDPKPNVMLLNVISDPRNVSKSVDNAHESTKSEGKRVLSEARAFFLKEAGSADTVSTMVAIGEPRQVIVEIVKANEIDHLIMGGSDYQWKITDLLSGGVTNYIMHHLNCVITVIK
ncbi:MAG: universal stress protein [Balneolales bacterium]|nr:universal stress protein [Balneolales bacterium]